MKILLVDDAPEIRRAMGAALRSVPGVEQVECVAGIAQAIEAIEAGRADLVVLDIQLGGRERGIDLLRHVVRRHPGVPVVMLSSYGWGEMRDGFAHAGAAAYFQKGSETDALRAWIARAAAHPPGGLAA